MEPNSPKSEGAAKNAEPDLFQPSIFSASLTVKDLSKSIAWYQDVVGFVVDRKIEREGKLRGVALKAGNVRLSINQDDGAKGWDRIKGEGFSFLFTTDQNIDAIANRIKAHGWKLETEPADMPWGSRAFRLKDPDGYKFSISSPRRA